MKLLIAALLALQTLTAIALVDARHELRTVQADVEEHDGMLEQIGDAVDQIEVRP